MPIDLETLNTFSHRQLQVLAKEYGVAANQKRAKIIREVSAVSAQTAHWQSCQQLRLRLARVEGFSVYLPTPPEDTKSRKWRALEVRQLWDALKLGTSLCFLFNQIPEIADIDLDLGSVDTNDEESCKASTAMFFKALSDLEQSGKWSGSSFHLSDLYDEAPDPQTVIKVVNVVIGLVDLLPYSNSNRHIHDLPVETLSAIFQILATASLEEYPIPPPTILLVCRRWHDIALQTGTLWTRIDIEKPLRTSWRKVTKEAEKITSFVRLSKDKELALILHTENQDITSTQLDLSEYLAAGAQRIGTLVLTHSGFNWGARDYISRQLRTLESMPRLHTLRLRVTSIGLSQGISSTSLRYLEMSNASLSWKGCRLPNLVSLKLVDRWSWEMWEITHFASAIASMPHLQNLSLHFSAQSGAYDPPAAGVPRATLPALTKLELGGPDYFLNTLLHLFAAPQLRQLRLQGLVKTEPLLNSTWGGTAVPFPDLESLALWFVPSPRPLLKTLLPARDIRLDVLAVGERDTEFFGSRDGVVCKGLGVNWDCGHEECEALAAEQRLEDAAVRLRTDSINAAGA